MEPSSQEPQQTPEPTNPPVQEPVAQEQPAPLSVKKKSKKPLIISLTVLILLVAAGCAGWFWWSSQQKVNDTATDTPAKNSVQQKAPEPNTVAYGYNTSNFQAASELYWRPAGGGEPQTAPTKTFTGSSRVYGNQVLIETYYNDPTKSAASILYSKDGGKTYTTVFTGKAPATATDMGDQITGMQFASDGKSVVFAVLADSGKNTVKQVAFDKPATVTDLMTSDARGVFLIGYNVKSQTLIFSEGCYNCDGGGASTSAFAYYVASKKRTTLVDGTDKHLGILANKTATKLVISAPTIDKTKTGGEGGEFYGYYVGAPYTLNVFEIGANKPSDVTATVGNATDSDYIRIGFMADDSTPYYYKSNQLFSLGKGTSTLLYESGQPLYEVHYVSTSTVFASTGTYDNFVLNRFGIKDQETKQILTGDVNTTRIFGITEQ